MDKTIPRVSSKLVHMHRLLAMKLHLLQLKSIGRQELSDNDVKVSKTFDPIVLLVLFDLFSLRNFCNFVNKYYFVFFLFSIFSRRGIMEPNTKCHYMT